MHHKDIVLLKKIQSFFGVGNITIRKKDGAIFYTVQSIKDLTNVIIPHFLKYPLLSKKRADFLLFKSIVDLMNKGEHLTTEGLNKIVGIKASMNRGLSDSLRESFPNIASVDRPLVESTEVSDPYWLVGFVDGEGCFHVQIVKSKLSKMGYAVSLRFKIGQHSRDYSLMESLVKYLDCGATRVDSSSPAVYFSVSKFADINNNIRSFFDKYQLQGSKRLDYSDFCKVIDLMKEKVHLTNEGLKQIREIKSHMNSGREHN